MSLPVVSSAPAALGAVVPEDSGGPYVAAAYVVFLSLIAIYVAIMAQRLARISKQTGELEAKLARVPASSGAGVVQGSTGPGAVQGSTGAGPVQDGAAREGLAVEPRHAHGGGGAAASATAAGSDAPAVTS